MYDFGIFFVQIRTLEIVLVLIIFVEKKGKKWKMNHFAINLIL